MSDGSHHIGPGLGRTKRCIVRGALASVNYQLIAGDRVDIDDVSGVRRRKTKSTPPSAHFLLLLSLLLFTVFTVVAAHV